MGEAYENEHVRITPSQPTIEDDAWRPAPNAPPIPGHGRALRMLITVENKSNEPLPYQMTVHLKAPSGKLVAKRPPNVRERPLEIKPGASETFEHLFAITEKVPGEFSAEISAPAYRTVRRFEFRFSL